MLELSVDTEAGTTRLQFEHSLRSLSKWESITRKPFSMNAEKLPSEMITYFQCMVTTPGADLDLVYALAPEQLDQLTEYINQDQTASWITENTKPGQPEETLTSELIYYWMTALRIDWQAQDWHLSRLMMLIRITSHKQQPPKKRKPTDVYNDWRAENDRRRKLLGTTG